MIDGECYSQSLSPDPSQGEIISDLVQYIPSGFTADGSKGFRLVTHTHAVVLSQTCDLIRRKADAPVPDMEVLFCSMQLEAECIANFKEPNLLKTVRQNSHPRFHYLRALPVEVGMSGEELIGPFYLDFRRIFTVHYSEMIAQFNEGSAKRVVELLPPYREHLAFRYAYYLSRVALPVDHYLEIKNTALLTPQRLPPAEISE
jgi:hypothetical protein